jgi:hypothetical protein
MNVTPQIKNLSVGIKATRTRDYNWLKLIWFKRSWFGESPVAIRSLHNCPFYIFVISSSNEELFNLPKLWKSRAYENQPRQFFLFLSLLNTFFMNIYLLMKPAAQHPPLLKTNQSNLTVKLWAKWSFGATRLSTYSI